jgi:hypothetical protein
MLAFAAALVLLGRWFARNDPACLSDVIRRALAAPPAHAQFAEGAIGDRAAYAAVGGAHLYGDVPHRYGAAQLLDGNHRHSVIPSWSAGRHDCPFSQSVHAVWRAELGLGVGCIGVRNLSPKITRLARVPRDDRRELDL